MRPVLVLASVIAAFLIAGVGAVGCLGTPKFQCAAANDCLNGSVQGKCETDGYCSFPDPGCESGQRYGDLSGPMSGQCVPRPIDAPPDAFVPDMYVHDARECFGGTGAYQLCFDMMPPMGNVTLTGTLDTVNDTRCVAMPASWMTAGQPDACMILGKAVTIQTVVVTGARPLVVLGDTITISGTLEASSRQGQVNSGPGYPSAACPAGFPQSPATNINGAGGGAGGSFRTLGGSGGAGKNNSAAGTPNAVAPVPTVLRSGCPGQQGGAGTLAAGNPGRGGGAVFLTASKITFMSTGVINASGEGGFAGAMNSGGSGGGSGGMIVLHATESFTSMAGAKLMANGGGGSSGANQLAIGDNGNDPVTGQPTTPAAGGDVGNAGQGGSGFAGSTAAMSGQDAQAMGGNRDTGGGGGGGGGYIQTNMTITNITSSPSQSVVP